MRSLFNTLSDTFNPSSSVRHSLPFGSPFYVPTLYKNPYFDSYNYRFDCFPENPYSSLLESQGRRTVSSNPGPSVPMSSVSPVAEEPILPVAEAQIMPVEEEPINSDSLVSSRAVENDVVPLSNGGSISRSSLDYWIERGLLSEGWRNIDSMVGASSRGRIVLSTLSSSSSSTFHSALSSFFNPEHFSLLVPLLFPIGLGFSLYWASVPDLVDLPLTEVINRALLSIGRAREIVEQTATVLNDSTTSTPGLSTVRFEDITGPVAHTTPPTDPLTGGVPLDRNTRSAALVLGYFTLVVLITCASTGSYLTDLE